MTSILFLILITAFATIGTIEWLKTISAAFKAKKGWLWPMVSAIVAIGVGLASVYLWPFMVKDIQVDLKPIALWPFMFFITLATIQLGYDIVVKTFLALIEKLNPSS